MALCVTVTDLNLTMECWLSLCLLQTNQHVKHCDRVEVSKVTSFVAIATHRHLLPEAFSHDIIILS